MRWLAVLLTLSLCTGCFPNNGKHRTIAKITEGAFVAGGVAILALSSTQADCNTSSMIPGVREDCEADAGSLSALGFGMILVGLIGFIATVSTQPDDPPAK